MQEPLEGQNIKLRPISPEDTEAILLWRNSDEIRRSFIMRETLTKEMHEQWLNTKVATGEVVQFIIVEKDSEIGIGTVYLRNIDPKLKQAEFGIFIGNREARGKGYGAEACNMILDYSWSYLELNGVYLRVKRENHAAIKSYENCGFATMEKEQLPQSASPLEDEEQILLMCISNPNHCEDSELDIHRTAAPLSLEPGTLH